MTDLTWFMLGMGVNTLLLSTAVGFIDLRRKRESCGRWGPGAGIVSAYRERKKAVAAEHRALERQWRAERKKERAKRRDHDPSCFWTWPWGHQFNSLVCRTCGKSAPGTNRQYGW